MVKKRTHLDHLIEAALEAELESLKPTPEVRERILRRLESELDKRFPAEKTGEPMSVARKTRIRQWVLAAVAGVLLAVLVAPQAPRTVAKAILEVIQRVEPGRWGIEVKTESATQPSPKEPPNSDSPQQTLEEAKSKAPYVIPEVTGLSPEARLAEVQVAELAPGKVRVALIYELPDEKRLELVIVNLASSMVGAVDQYDKDRFRVTNVPLKDVEARLIEPMDNVSPASLVWVEGDVKYELRARLTSEELITLAKSLGAEIMVGGDRGHGTYAPWPWMPSSSHAPVPEDAFEAGPRLWAPAVPTTPTSSTTSLASTACSVAPWTFGEELF